MHPIPSDNEARLNKRYSKEIIDNAVNPVITVNRVNKINIIDSCVKISKSCIIVA